MRLIITKKFSQCCKGSEPHVRLPSLGIPRESDLETQRDLITRLPQDWGNRDSRLGGHKQNHAHTKTQRKGAETPQETEPNLPAGVGGSPVEAWVSRSSLQGWGDWAACLGSSPLV